MAGKLDDFLQFNQTVLSLRSQRQQLLAANIANADTPNFKARDIDFNQAIKGAMGGGSGAAAKAVTMAVTSPMHMSGSTAALVSASGAKPMYRTVLQGAVDGNTVDMDVERNAFVDNGIRYEAGVQAVTGQIRGLMSAIQGQ
jgi:flagellar basal-body rod protein FlgB